MAGRQYRGGFTSIEDDVRGRPTRHLGTIHTGLPRGPKGEPGKEVSYFVLDFDAVDEDGRPDDVARAYAASVARVFGEKPEVLEAVLLSDSGQVNAPYEFKKYTEGSRKPVCRGNGQICHRKVLRQGQYEMVSLPCPRPEACSYALDADGRPGCHRETTFTVMLPRVTLVGTFLIRTTSVYAQRNYQDWERLTGEVYGRVKGVPVLLRRKLQRSELLQGGQVVHFPVDFETAQGLAFQKTIAAFRAGRRALAEAEGTMGYEEGVDAPCQEEGVDVGPELPEAVAGKALLEAARIRKEGGFTCEGCGKKTDIPVISAAGVSPDHGWCAECAKKEYDERNAKVEKKKRGRKKKAEEAPPAVEPQDMGSPPTVGESCGLEKKDAPAGPPAPVDVNLDDFEEVG